jgi:hypothetical protein
MFTAERLGLRRVPFPVASVVSMMTTVSMMRTVC